jgi:CheY-like chemotaxis protein
VGTIAIETDNRTFGEEFCARHPGCLPGDYVVLVVRDDGSGMDKETMAHLFEPFFTTKAVGKGTGLGLATVYGIVKQNNGFITVESEPGMGTTFSIHLPRLAGENFPVQGELWAAPLIHGHGTILVVEDEPTLLHLIVSMLKGKGYTLLAADSPMEATRMAQEHNGAIHLLLTDVIMPDMNGRELANKLQPSYPHMKCLFMSGYTADIIDNHGVLEKGVGFIQKPFSMTTLTEKIQETLKND